MASRVIDAVLRLTDNFTGPLQKSIDQMTNCSKSAVKIGREVEKFGSKISKIGTVATAAVTTPLVGLSVTSTKAFGEVDENLRLIQQTMSSTDEEASMLEAAVKKAAEGSVFGMSDAAEATLNYARAGFNASEAAALIEPALSLAAGTATDLSLTTTGLGGAMKAFRLNMEDAGHVADVFAKSQAQANITATDLIDVIGIGAPMFKTVGWSFEDMATAADLFGDAVIPVNEGMTAMKTGLMRLADPKETGFEAVDKAVQSLFDANGQMKSFVDTQQILHDSFAGLNDQQKLLAANTLFGKNQGAKWIALIDSAPETVNKYRDSLDDCAGTAKNMADALMSGTGGAIESLGSAFDVMQYNIGSLLGSQVSPFLQAITSLIVKFNDMDSEQQKQIIKWAMMAAAVGPVLLIIGKVFGIIGSGIVKFNQFGMALKAAGGFMGLMMSPIMVVIGAIAALVAIVLIVRKHMDVFRGSLQALSPMFASINDHVQSIINKFTALWATVKPIASAIANLFGIVLTAAIGGLVGYITSTVDAILLSIDNFMSILNGIVDFVAGAFTGNWELAWQGVKEIFEGIAGGIESTFRAVINGIVGFVNGFIGGLNSVKIPDWVPGVGGKSLSIPLIPTLATGTDFWPGGIVQVSERGGEIIDLPRGSRVYPHDESVAMARREGASMSRSASVTITGNTFNVRSEADIEKIGDAIVRKLKKANENRGGWTFSGNMA